MPETSAPRERNRAILAYPGRAGRDLLVTQHIQQRNANDDGIATFPDAE